MPVESLPFGKYTPFFNELALLYANMDRQYHETARYYGFQCRGCSDNCCMTFFYHHTHIEQLYLLNGYLQLGFDVQEAVRNRARIVNQQMPETVAQGSPPRLMCALNEEGLCLLYESRPMICRLHGIPHELKAPGRKPVLGSGCSEFVRICSDRGYRVFDRTPFYTALAGLEQRFKQTFNITGKFKKTVSEFF